MNVILRSLGMGIAYSPLKMLKMGFSHTKLSLHYFIMLISLIIGVSCTVLQPYFKHILEICNRFYRALNGSVCFCVHQLFHLFQADQNLYFYSWLVMSFKVLLITFSTCDGCLKLTILLVLSASVPLRG